MKVYFFLFIGLLFLRVTEGMAAIFSRELVWDTDEINVCFFDNYNQLPQVDRFLLEDSKFKPAFFTNEEKLNIKRIVNKNFSKETTKLSFKGWKNCSEAQSYNAMIIKAKPATMLSSFLGRDWRSKGRSTIGKGGYWDQERKVFKINTEDLPTLALNTQNNNFILHEFGHLAGLFHEDEHPELIQEQDLDCKFRVNNKHPHQDVPFRYDKDSIMSYCSIFNNDRPIGLSERDKETLNTMY